MAEVEKYFSALPSPDQVRRQLEAAEREAEALRAMLKLSVRAQRAQTAKEQARQQERGTHATN